MAGEFDRMEKDFNPGTDFEWVRVLDENGNSIKISKSDFYMAINRQTVYGIEPGEIEVYDNIYGLYQVDDYNSGATAIFLSNYIGVTLLHSLGGDYFSATEGSKTLSLYKKGGNTPLYLSNNTNTARSVGFKKL